MSYNDDSGYGGGRNDNYGGNQGGYGGGGNNEYEGERRQNQGNDGGYGGGNQGGYGGGRGDNYGGNQGGYGGGGNDYDGDRRQQHQGGYGGGGGNDFSGAFQHAQEYGSSEDQDAYQQAAQHLNQNQGRIQQNPDIDEGAAVRAHEQLYGGGGQGGQQHDSNTLVSI